MKFKAIVWPDIKRIGSLELQVAYGFDPEIVRFFESRFIVDDIPDHKLATAYEATEDQWRTFAKRWSKEEPINRGTSRNLH